MVCASCFPQQFPASSFGAGRMGEETKCSLAAVPSPRCKPSRCGAGGPGTLPMAPLLGQQWRWEKDRTVLWDAHFLRADAYKLFVKFLLYICHEFCPSQQRD